MAITVTDPKGLTLPGIQVGVTGTTTRSGETDASGNINFTGLMAGTYRLRFDGEKWISFEREVTLSAGKVQDVDVALNPAPEPPPPPPAPAPAPEPVAPATKVGPKGQPQTVAILDWLDKEFVGRDPRRESILACSGNERTTILQLNEPMPQRLYEEADVVYYVLGGEGSVSLDGKNARITTNGFVSVPRGTPHSFEKRGNRPIHFSLDDVQIPVPERADSLLVLNDVLDRLEAMDEQQAKIVEMRFFGGMSNAEIAECMDISERTVGRDWQAARLWLYRELNQT